MIPTSNGGIKVTEDNSNAVAFAATAMQEDDRQRQLNMQRQQQHQQPQQYHQQFVNPDTRSFNGGGENPFNGTQMMSHASMPQLQAQPPLQHFNDSQIYAQWQQLPPEMQEHVLRLQYQQQQLQQQQQYHHLPTAPTHEEAYNYQQHPNSPRRQLSMQSFQPPTPQQQFVPHHLAAFHATPSSSTQPHLGSQEFHVLPQQQIHDSSEYPYWHASQLSASRQNVLPGAFSSSIGPSTSSSVSYPHFDLTDQALSAAFASNAHIEGNNTSSQVINVPTANEESTPLATESTFRTASRPLNMRPNIYQQYSNLNLKAMERRLQSSSKDCLPFIHEVIYNYISTPSRLGLGERTVLVMTSKVAQKSYGAEKRFLCPPPMTLLVGSSWWSACQGGNPGIHESAPTVLTPPKLSIAMSNEGAEQDGVLEWASSSGRLIDTDNPSSEFAISGRSISKQLFISDSDEKHRNCEALVRLSVPGVNAEDHRLLGIFASKPIKIISKPSKKRQNSRNTDLGLAHGSTISLFHRLRSQTVSTRYLCMSGSPRFKGSDGNAFLNTDANTHIPNQGDAPSSFVAKTSSWDPFIVYLVDPHMRTSGGSQIPHSQLPPHYPLPPANAISIPGENTSIHYNQPIVLQCLNTAFASPVMVIRKVEKGTTVVGGGHPLTPFGPSGPPPGETYGEPISQLHKVAFEILEDPKDLPPEPAGSPGASGHFLGCLNEEIGLRKVSARQWISAGFSHSRPDTPTTPITPLQMQSSSSSSLFNEYKAEPSMTSPTQQTTGRFGGGYTPYGTNVPTESSSSDGGKVKRPRRVSSSIVIPQRDRGSTPSASTSTKNRRRGQSLSVVGLAMQQQWQTPLTGLPASSSSSSLASAAGDLRRTSSFANSLASSDTSSVPTAAPSAWSVEVHDTDVWTIVGVDIARHTFYMPEVIDGVKPKAEGIDESIAHLLTVPAPSHPITPLPVLDRYTKTNNESNGEQIVTLIGENFTPDLYIFFGDWRSPQTTLTDANTIICLAPPAKDDVGMQRGRAEVILVRRDGIIFPSNVIYQP